MSPCTTVLNMLSSVQNINSASRLSRTATSVRFHGNRKGWKSFKLSLDSLRRQDGIDIPLDFVRPELSDAAWSKVTAKVAANADDSSEVSSNKSTSAPLRTGRSAGTGKIATAEPLPSQIDLDQENDPTSDAEEPEPAHSESDRHPRTNYESMFDENDKFISKHEDPELYKEAVAAYDLLDWRLHEIFSTACVGGAEGFPRLHKGKGNRIWSALKDRYQPNTLLQRGTLSAPIGSWLSSMARTLLIICFEHSWPFWIVRIWAV